jgi:hypothetical protein
MATVKKLVRALQDEFPLIRKLKKAPRQKPSAKSHGAGKVHVLGILENKMMLVLLWTSLQASFHEL